MATCTHFLCLWFAITSPFFILKKADLTLRIRLTGVSGQELNGGAPQLGLFTESAGPQRNDKLNQALDAIASKFGSKAVVTADLREDDPDDARDGFYREDKRATAKQAESQRQRQGPSTDREES